MGWRGRDQSSNLSDTSIDLKVSPIKVCSPTAETGQCSDAYHKGRLAVPHALLLTLPKDSLWLLTFPISQDLDHNKIFTLSFSNLQSDTRRRCSMSHIQKQMVTCHRFAGIQLRASCWRRFYGLNQDMDPAQSGTCLQITEFQAWEILLSLGSYHLLLPRVTFPGLCSLSEFTGLCYIFETTVRKSLQCPPLPIAPNWRIR